MIDHVTLHKGKIQDIGRLVKDADDVLVFKNASVFAIAPAKLDSVELPALYALTSQAVYNGSVMGEDYIQATRVYRVQVPVIPIGQATPEERESLCIPIIQAVIETFSMYPTLNNCSFVRAMGARVLSDSGVVVLPEWGAKFVGFEMRLQVIYDMPRAYATGE